MPAAPAHTPEEDSAAPADAQESRADLTDASQEDQAEAGPAADKDADAAGVGAGFVLADAEEEAEADFAEEDTMERKHRRWRFWGGAQDLR